MKGPIRYFGGKGGMYKEILAHFPDKETYDTYLEPFGGGASILFQKEPSPIEIYNDLEENVYSLFRVLSDKKMFKEFKEKCDTVYYSKQIRDEFKVDLKTDKLDIVDRAFKFFYVNRSSINSIGGFSLALVVRRKMSKSVSDMLSAIDTLIDIHNRLSSVVIENRDGIDLIKKYDRKNVFIYADPPYHHSTRGGARYKQDMNNDEQDKFIKTMLGLENCKMLLSGYDCETYKPLADNGWIQSDFIINTIDGTRKPKVKIETLWRNYELVLSEKAGELFEL